MKYLVISDIHGSAEAANIAIEAYKLHHCDYILCLGDILYHGPRNDLPSSYAPKQVISLLNPLKDKIIAVRGNCDAEVDEMISEFGFENNIVLNENGRKIFFTHGHKYNIEKLPKEEFDIMMYGHFHTGFIKEKEGK